jgi:hypothetical protein
MIGWSSESSTPEERLAQTRESLTHLGALVFTAMMVVMLVEALDAHRRR